MDQKALFVVPIALAFFSAIIFLTAFTVVLVIRKKALLIAGVAAGSFLFGTFVVFNPGLSRGLITPLTSQSASDPRTFETFGQQMISGLFRSPDVLLQAIVVGSIQFGISVTLWGLLFWYTGRGQEVSAVRRKNV